MCTIASRILEVEMKLEQARNAEVPQPEIDELVRELKELEKEFEAEENKAEPEDDLKEVHELGKFIFDNLK